MCRRSYIGFIDFEGKMVKIGLIVKTAYRSAENIGFHELLHQKALYLIMIIYWPISGL